jgi:DNA-binding NtrC family response regulator
MQEQEAAMMRNRSVVSRKRIMVINHEAEFAGKVADWLAADGYEVIIAQEVRDVIDLLKEMEPDGILLDLHLPIMNGVELLRIIRAIYPHVPVVTMAEATLQDLAVLSVKAGASTFLLKPFDHHHMCQLLGAEIRGSRNERTRHGFARKQDEYPEE